MTVLLGIKGLATSAGNALPKTTAGYLLQAAIRGELMADENSVSGLTMMEHLAMRPIPTPMVVIVTFLYHGYWMATMAAWPRPCRSFKCICNTFKGFFRLLVGWFENGFWPYGAVPRAHGLAPAYGPLPPRRYRRLWARSRPLVGSNPPWPG